MKWLFFRFAAALLLTLALSLGLTFAVFEGVGGVHDREFAEVQSAVLAPISARISRLSPQERMRLVDDARDRLGFEIALEHPSNDAKEIGAAADGLGAMRFAAHDGKVVLYARIAGTADWIRMGPLDRPAIPSKHPVGFAIVSLIVVAAVAFALSRAMAMQLASLYEATARLEAGDMSARASVHSRSDLGKLASAFNAMASRRQADLVERDALLQAVAHELGTPLARMHFSLDFLRHAETQSARDREVVSMEEELTALDELVRELVTWVESASERRAPLDEQAAGVLDLVRERVDRVGRHARVAIEIVDRLGAEVRIGDCGGFRRVLDNLLRNAERYSVSEVVVEVRDGDGDVLVEVRDDGPGVPEEHRARVFEPFTRLEHARSRDQGGVGLGLAIVARTVARAGGRAWVSSAPEGGATFAFTWPRV